MKALVVRAPLFSFFALAFALSWAVTIPMVLLHGPPQWMVLATFGPTIAALMVSRFTTTRNTLNMVLPQYSIIRDGSR